MGACLSRLFPVPSAAPGLTQLELFFSSNQDSFNGDHSVNFVGTGGTGRVEFFAPDNFGAVLAAEMIIIPRGTNAAANIDMLSDYGAVGQDKATHSQSDLASTYNITLDEIFAIDISGIITSLAAGDFVGIQIDNNSGTDVDVIGIRFRYSFA